MPLSEAKWRCMYYYVFLLYLPFSTKPPARTLRQLRKVSWSITGLRNTARSYLHAALVVFFFDLEWDEPQWEEKVTECNQGHKVRVCQGKQALQWHAFLCCRAALDGRHTELAVPLIQTPAAFHWGRCEATLLASVQQASLHREAMMHTPLS